MFKCLEYLNKYLKCYREGEKNGNDDDVDERRWGVVVPAPGEDDEDDETDEDEDENN